MMRRDIDEATALHLRGQVKEQLRERMRGLRRVLPKSARSARSAAIVARLLALPEFERATTLVAYRALGAEADPAEALRAAEAAGKLVGLPRVAAPGRLELHRHGEARALVTGAYGIEEPSPDAELIADDAVQLIIVPALVFDDRGHRVGYGQGYYDRLLPRLSNAFKVVIGYDFQRVVETPDAEHDVPLDCVVTDARTIRIGRG